MKVRAKKSLGQHFLKNKNVAERIALSLMFGYKDIDVDAGEKARVLEVGPGTGALTEFLLKREDCELKVVEIDRDSIAYLSANYPQLSGRIIEGDFLDLELDKIFQERFSLIGNFPYNISSQIFFKVLDYKNLIPEVVCMIQREVAVRLASGPGNRDYGILSVLLQVWYNIEYLFTVDENQFSPPPRVKSAVIRVTRNSREHLECSEELFKKIVKMTFNQRRKTIKNSLERMVPTSESVKLPYIGKRPEQLGVEQFIELTNAVSAILN